MAIATTPTVVIPADHLPGPPQGALTDADYRNLPDDGQHYELIEGVLYMTPAAGSDHQFANNRFQTKAVAVGCLRIVSKRILCARRLL